MNQLRPRQKRSLGFEALEGRLTLSTGLAVASPHSHALVVSRAVGRIPASFQGHTSINGSTQTTPDLTGRIGTDRFTGYGTGTTSGVIVQAGEVFLSNSHGTIHLSLGAASVTRVGGRSRQEVPVVVTGSTGKYAPYAGATGLLTTWNVPGRPQAASRFSGYFNRP